METSWRCNSTVAGAIEQKLANSKAFAIPFLTAFAFIMFNMIVVRIGIANVLE